MALNTCNHLVPLHFVGLMHKPSDNPEDRQPKNIMTPLLVVGKGVKVE